jgi:hypothetical protein
MMNPLLLAGVGFSFCGDSGVFQINRASASIWRIP